MRLDLGELIIQGKVEYAGQSLYRIKEAAI